MRQRTAATARRNRHSESSRPILAKNLASSLSEPPERISSTNASLPALKKALERPMRNSEWPRSKARSSATENIAGG
eukprot:6906355-Prymnesium_polylepis.1